MLGMRSGGNLSELRSSVRRTEHLRQRFSAGDAGEEVDSLLAPKLGAPEVVASSCIRYRRSIDHSSVARSRRGHLDMSYAGLPSTIG